MEKFLWIDYSDFSYKLSHEMKRFSYGFYSFKCNETIINIKLKLESRYEKFSLLFVWKGAVYYEVDNHNSQLFMYVACHKDLIIKVNAFQKIKI